MKNKKMNKALINMALIQSILYSTIPHAYAQGVEVNDLSQEKVKELLELNVNLTFVEKSFIYDTYIILEENAQYIGEEHVEDFLLNTNIEYKNDDDNFTKSGLYYYADHLIELSTSSINEEIEAIALHEVLHGYTDNIGSGTTDYNRIYNDTHLNEIYNEICTQEYIDELGLKRYVSMYDNDLIIGYVLESIVGNETIKKYKFNSNIDIIVEELENAGNSREDILLFFDNLTMIQHYLYLKNNNAELKQEFYLNVFDALNTFYQNKHGQNMLDNNEILLLLENTVLCNDLVKEKINEYVNNTKNLNPIYSLTDADYVYEPHKLSVEYKEIFNNTEGKKNNKFLYNNKEVVIKSDDVKNEELEVFNEKFINALINNQNLSNAEKYLVQNTLGFINENYQLLNQNYILEIVENLNIVTNKYEDSSYFIEEDFTLYFNNTDSNLISSALFSEILQLYIANENSYSDYVYDVANNMYALSYGVNTEFKSNEKNDFSLDATFTLLVYYLVGEDFLLDYKFNPSKDVLYNKIMLLGYTEEEIIQILNLFEEVHKAKQSNNVSEEINACIYKLYNFLSTVNPDSTCIRYKEWVECIMKENIENNYYIDHENKTTEQIFYLGDHDEINIFGDYENGKDFAAHIR
ncbi:MAG: hypothetical protein R3Y13_00570 [bacterium]